MDAAEKLYLQYLPENSFSALKKKLIVTTVDLNTGKIVYFSEGELIKPLMASSSLPIIFAPVQMGNTFYVDGGLLNNLPVEPLLDKCDKIIGAHCNPINEGFTVKGFKGIFERTFLLIINSNTFDSRKYCDVFIEPPALGQFSILDLAKAQEMFEIGYQYTLSMQPQLEALRGDTFQ
jgi:NTE family protein